MTTDGGPYVHPSQPDILGLRWDHLAAAKASRDHLRRMVIITAHSARQALRAEDQDRYQSELDWIAWARRRHTTLIKEYGV